MLEGRYRLESVVGRGGMGTVYRALDMRLNRHVAVKVLRETHAADAVRFKSEIETLARLSHPGLVRILDAGGLDAGPYLVMELIEGKNLAQLLENGPLRPEEVATIGASVAAALAYVHDNGIVHRDVKPANVLLDRDGGAHLADFGVAQLAEKTGLTTTGLTLGTPAYLAPEQIEGGDIGASVDVYALGLVLVECLSGRRAFEGTPAEITGARLQRDPTLPSGLSEQWYRVLSGMTARVAGDRLGARAAAAELSGLIDLHDPDLTVPLGARSRYDVGVVAPFLLDPTQRVTTAVDAPTTILPRSNRRGSASRWWARHRRDPTMIAAIAVAILVVVLALGALLMGTNQTRGATAASTGAAASPSTSTTMTPSTIATSPALTDARALATAISAGVANGTIDPGVGQQLTHQLAPLLVAPTTSTPQQRVTQVNQLAQTFSQAVNAGAIVVTSTVASMSTAINSLAAALGASAPLSLLGTGPGSVGPGHGHGHGNGGDH